ncbi:hypothetical protein JVT61DRAFT_6125 [Boletus reticuloceps]|uniref:Uncharacterized protein n=1 Tax=Boletus reticuloceps TaxID=495285 RepID=A0A8I2YKR9_9AGAM|nr:hypothetical protein JVT61DRAFT_6125 [Boletus reticuloceps]
MHRHYPYFLCGCQIAWVVGHFYAHDNWHFSNCNECRQFFVDLVDHFDEKWPVRENVFPHLPLDIELDCSQKQELKSKKNNLFHHLVLLWKWFTYGQRNFDVEFSIISLLEPIDE